MTSTKDPQLYKKLFVTNIPGDISKEYFVQLIEPYAKNGKILETKFFKRVVSESCYAFIHFESSIDGEKCMEDLNRRILNGHTMRVGPASKRNPLLSTTNLYIEGVPKEWTDTDLRKHFGEFGEIAAARILVDKGSHTSREVGFVHFTNHENALSAMETWQDVKAYKTAERPFKIKFANKGRKKDEDDNLDSINNKKVSLTQQSSLISTITSSTDNNNNSNILTSTSYTSPVGPSQYPQSEMNTPRFDEPCRYFQRGNCKRGKNCFYRHGNVTQIINNNTNSTSNSSTRHNNNYHTHSHSHPPPPPHQHTQHHLVSHHTHNPPQTHYDPYTAAAVSASMAAAASAASIAAYHTHPQTHIPGVNTTATTTDPSLTAYYQQYYGAYTHPQSTATYPPQTAVTTATTTANSSDPATAAYYAAYPQYQQYPHYGVIAAPTMNTEEQKTNPNPNPSVTTDTAASVTAPGAVLASAGYGATRAGVNTATDARWDPYKQAQATYPYNYAAPTQ